MVAASRWVQESTGSREVRVPVDRATGRDSQTRPAGSTLWSVDTKQEIREFLTSRRARITPDQVELTSYGPRRVPGLRREEVAVLAGVSIQYYTRLERGDMNGVSESVLERTRSARFSSTTPNAPISSTSPAPHTQLRRDLVAARPSSASGPRSSGPSTRSPAPPRS